MQGPILMSGKLLPLPSRVRWIQSFSCRTALVCASCVITSCEAKGAIMCYRGSMQSPRFQHSGTRMGAWQSNQDNDPLPWVALKTLRDGAFGYL
eukprot:1855239-Amphidinium_carterae.1